MLQVVCTLPEGVAGDIVDLINSVGSLAKDARVNYKGVKFDYVTLDSMLGAVKRFGKVGINFNMSRSAEGVTSITPLLIHRATGTVLAGGTMSYRDAELAGTGRPGPQTTGMVITYCKRYSLAAVLGIASDDDTDATLQEPEQLRERAVAEATQSVPLITADQRDALGALKSELDGATIKALAQEACGCIPWDAKGNMTADNADKLIMRLSAEVSRRHFEAMPDDEDIVED